MYQLIGNQTESFQCFHVNSWVPNTFQMNPFQHGSITTLDRLLIIICIVDRIFRDYQYFLKYPLVWKKSLPSLGMFIVKRVCKPRCFSYSYSGLESLDGMASSSETALFSASKTNGSWGCRILKFKFYFTLCLCLGTHRKWHLLRETQWKNWTQETEE